MNLKIILPLVFVCGDPQLRCHPLKSPVTTIVWLFVFITLLRFLRKSGLFGAMYIEFIIIVCLDSILVAIASKSSLMMCCVGWTELWTRRANPQNLLVAMLVITV